MAYIELTYRSTALKMNVTVSVLLPEKKGSSGAPEGETFKTLYLLHGTGANHTDWIRKTNIERYAMQYGIAVVMPEVGRTWYTDTQYDLKYFTFVADELPAVCRSYFKGMSPRREDNMIGGFSMGGYGALKVALQRPDAFCACASLSGSLDITRQGRPYVLGEWQSLFGYDLKDASELKDSEHDIFALARRNHEAGTAFPRLYLWCGQQDSLIDTNRDYHALLEELCVPHRFEESQGNHTWPWWDRHIQTALAFLMEEKDPEISGADE